MNGSIARALAALIFAALLWMQARRTRDQPHRRRAFELAAGALLVLAALQGSLAAGMAFDALLYVMVAAVLVLLVAAVATLLSSFRSGEMRGQSDKIARAAQEYRERREQDGRRMTDDER
jgi:heme A synthase